MNRPACPGCGRPIHTIQDVPGGIAVTYPCACWFTPAQARQLAAQLDRITR